MPDNRNPPPEVREMELLMTANMLRVLHGALTIVEGMHDVTQRLLKILQKNGLACDIPMPDDATIKEYVKRMQAVLASGEDYLTRFGPRVH